MEGAIPARWLRRFRIIHRICILETGEELNLRTRSDNAILLEGGVLTVKLVTMQDDISQEELVEEVLVRTGKSGKALYFVRTYCKSSSRSESSQVEMA